MLPENIARKFREFQAKTGIRDPRVDLQLNPKLVTMKKSTSTTFRLSGNPMFKPDMHWKYRTIGLIIPDHKLDLDWMNFDFGDGDSYSIYNIAECGPDVTTHTNVDSTAGVNTKLLERLVSYWEGIGRRTPGEDYFDAEWDIPPKKLL